MLITRKQLLTCHKCGKTSNYISHLSASPREYEWEDGWRTDIRPIPGNGIGEVKYFDFCPDHAPDWTVTDWMPNEPFQIIRRESR